jgi:hypothetical protein
VAHLCIKPACGNACSGCNRAIPQEVAISYAILYAHLRAKDLDTVHKGGVFAGRTPQNVVLNGEDLDAAIYQEMQGA